MSKSKNTLKKILIVAIWLSITVSLQLYGSMIMEYSKLIIGLRTMNFLSGAAGVFVLIILLGGILHFTTHIATAHRR